MQASKDDPPDPLLSQGSFDGELDSSGSSWSGTDPASHFDSGSGQSEPNGSRGGASAEVSEALGNGRRERSGFVEALALVLVALVLALTVKTYVAEAYEIKGRSMEKTFANGQRVVVLKSFYDIRRGDIIVFASSEDPGKDLIKRVIGLPGENVKIEHGAVYIDGKRLNEDYARPDALGLRDHPCQEKVGTGRYFVMGDNRPDSHDSRAFHAIPASSIKGKVLVRWWPLSQFSSF